MDFHLRELLPRFADRAAASRKPQQLVRNRRYSFMREILHKCALALRLCRARPLPSLTGLLLCQERLL